MDRGGEEGLPQLRGPGRVHGVRAGARRALRHLGRAVGARAQAAQAPGHLGRVSRAGTLAPGAGPSRPWGGRGQAWQLTVLILPLRVLFTAYHRPARPDGRALPSAAGGPPEEQADPTCHRTILTRSTSSRR